MLEASARLRYLDATQVLGPTGDFKNFQLRFSCLYVLPRSNASVTQ